MARGDHLIVDYFWYWHHAIDIGDGTVVERSKKERAIRRVSLKTFCDGRRVQIQQYEECYPPSVVVDRALANVGKPGYHLWHNNCEHFATWCKIDKFESAQVRRVQGVVRLLPVEILADTGRVIGACAAVELRFLSSFLKPHMLGVLRDSRLRA